MKDTLAVNGDIDPTDDKNYSREATYKNEGKAPDSVYLIAQNLLTRHGLFSDK